MTSPLVTIYITNYNYEKYIEQAISSVLNQSLQSFELFIIDDGSTDNSKEIIETFASNDKITIIYQKNKGLNITNNIALRLSIGKYIMRLDADDYLEPNALEKMVNILEADPELGMVFPDYFLVDGKNNITAEIKRHNFNEEVTLLDQPAHGACTMIRRSFLNAVGGYDESYSCQDGYELWIKFSTRYKVTNIREALFHYRQHGENLTSNENRILNTRRDINGNYILKNEIKRPKTIGIIPVRGQRLGASLLPFVQLNDKALLDIKIEEALQSQSLSLVIVTSNIQEVKNHVQETYFDNERVIFIERPEELARYNISLNATIQNVLKHELISQHSPEAFMILPIEFPFVRHDVINDAVNTLVIFKSDSLISTRQERGTLYQHHGGGMVPILQQETFTQLEREALYRGVGGIMLTMIDAFEKDLKLLAGKVGHISIDQKAAHGIYSSFDLKMANLLLELENEEKKMTVIKQALPTE